MGLTPSRWSIRIYGVLSELTSCVILGKPLNLCASVVSLEERGEWIRWPLGPLWVVKLYDSVIEPLPERKINLSGVWKMNCSESQVWEMGCPQNCLALLLLTTFYHCLTYIHDIYTYIFTYIHTYICTHTYVYCVCLCLWTCVYFVCVVYPQFTDRGQKNNL